MNWRLIQKKVLRLQMRIAKAVREKRWGKAKSLQYILTRSMATKLWATRRVVTNRGRNTPGVDGVLWKTPEQKIAGARSLKRRGYRPLPLRRIYIPKKDGKRKRPLSIPTKKDRAMQALHLLSLNPIAETLADENSYGYRPERSIADAHGKCFNALARKHSPEWVFEGDIESCFDRLSHEWLLVNIPMDKTILKLWLKAGYLKGRGFYDTREGTPQGGIISPALANMALDGLEHVAQSVIPAQVRAKGRSKIHLARYADDFIITARSREVLEDKVIPAVKAFLAERGLRLSSEKSKITPINAGFDFLGANVRKYNGKLLMKPTKSGVLRLLRECRGLIRKHCASRTDVLIRRLNAKLRGWGYQFRHLVASRCFGYIDHQIFESLKRWMRRRHPNKSNTWRNRKYFRSDGIRNWIFTATYNGAHSTVCRVDLVALSHLGLRRHVKIQSKAHPFDPTYSGYFRQRWLSKHRGRPRQAGGA